MFTVMREAALSTTPKEIGIKNLPDSKTVVFGILMEMNYDEGIAALVCYQTGDASMYVL
jgi:hypothetical protein